MSEVQNTVIKTRVCDTYINRAGAGKSEAIIFIHGSGPGAGSWPNWQHAIPALGEKYDAIGLDLAGFGKSYHPDPAPVGIRKWMRLWVNQVLALMDELKIEKAHLVGNSMGGAVALQILLDAPERFNKVVLMGPIGAPHTLTPGLDRVWGFYEDPSPEALAQLFSWFTYDFESTGGNLKKIAEMRYASAMEPNVARSFQAMFPRPRQEIVDQLVIPPSGLRRIEQPVMLVHGLNDPIVPLETSQHLLNHLPKVQMHVFGQCSHWTQIEFKNQFNSLLDSFFAGNI